jgi:hypothetical protein
LDEWRELRPGRKRSMARPGILAAAHRPERIADDLAVVMAHEALDGVAGTAGLR